MPNGPDNDRGNLSLRDQSLLWLAIALASAGGGYTLVGQSSSTPIDKTESLEDRVERLENRMAAIGSTVQRIDTQGPAIGNPRLRQELDNHAERIRGIELQMASDGKLKVNK